MDIFNKILMGIIIVVVLGVYLPSLFGFEIEFFVIAFGFFIALGLLTNIIIGIVKLYGWIFRD